MLCKYQGYSCMERVFMAIAEDPQFAYISTSAILPFSSEEAGVNIPPNPTTTNPAADEAFSLSSKLL